MNGDLFDLEITSHEGTLFSGKCDFVVAPTTTGEIGILCGHIPLMSIVSKGHIRIYREDSLVEKIGVNSGFIEATQNYVNILVGSTQP